jgi:membrane-associated phospholipid phosphatase
VPNKEISSLEGPQPGIRARERWSQRMPARAFLSQLRKVLLRIVLAVLSCAGLVAVSVQLLDRPASAWVHQHLMDTGFTAFIMNYAGHPLAIGPFSFMAIPAEALGPLSLFALGLLGVGAAAGWRPSSRGRVILVLSLSIPVAAEINKMMKSAFGRTWPESWLGDNPSWIRDGVFGFFPFHGGHGWESFPSGHTSAIATLATVLWVAWPELRFFWVAAVVMVVTGLIGANYHFISDVIGGLYLGIAVGLGSTKLMLSPGDRVSWSTLWGA